MYSKFSLQSSIWFWSWQSKFQTKRTIAHIFVAFSEKLEFIDITFNFSLTENQTVKLCDSALSRDLFPSDYHCLGDNNNRPIKWMPLESINQNRFSRASDVVSIKLPCVHKWRPTIFDVFRFSFLKAFVFKGSPLTFADSAHFWILLS